MLALVLVSLLFIATSAATNNGFNAKRNTEALDIQPTIYATVIGLKVTVTGCPEETCSCFIETSASDDLQYDVNFPVETPNIGSVIIEYLKPNTTYSLTLTCEGIEQRKILQVTTDNGYPTAPQNVTAELYSNYVEVIWEPPENRAGTLHGYRLIIDNKAPVELDPERRSYNIIEDYVRGINHTVVVLACNKNKANSSLCSSPKLGRTTFFLPTLTTTTTIFTVAVTVTSTSTTTTTNATGGSTRTSSTTTTTSSIRVPTTTSIGIHSYSMSIALICFSLFLFHFII